MDKFESKAQWQQSSHKVMIAYGGKKTDEKDFVGEKVITLYDMLKDPELTIEPADDGGIRFETKFAAMVLDETDGLYCEHKSAHADSWDTPGPTPDHPDTTHHGVYCDECNEWLEPEEPDYDE